MKLRTILLLATVTAMAAACSPSPTSSPSSQPSAGATSPTGSATASVPSATLDGRTFLSTAVTGATLVPGSTIRISFSNGALSANAGCNLLSGAYTIDGEVLKVGPMTTTDMACAEPLMAQDTWLAAFLDGATIRLEGNTLTLSKEGATLVLQDKEVVEPDRPLIGTLWVVDGLVSNQAVSSVPQGVVAALTFQDTQVSVDAGCNKGTGTVEIAANTITFDPIGLTKMTCGAGAMAVERAVLAVLSGQATYAIDGPTLSLTNGANGLTLRAGS